ncbi:Proteasome subunit beta type-7 [Mitosporidium daphniae]
MATFTENWGQSLPSSGSSYDVCQNALNSNVNRTNRKIITHTQSPIVTGTSVLGIVYSDGILLAADTLASYGSLARFRDVQRICSIGPCTILATSGDISDQQFLLSHLKQINISERYTSEKMSSQSYFHLVSKMMYERRSKMDPLWNSHIVAGIDGEKKFLGCVDLLGGKFESDSIATGFGAHLAQPILRRTIEEKSGGAKELSFEEAKSAIDTCMRVLYYRDARSLNKIQYGHISTTGQVQISEPLVIDSDWSIASFQ